MTNQKIAKILYEIEELLKIKGVAFFKHRAYHKAALALENLEENIDDIYKKRGIKGLKEISGIGKSIAEKIEEYLKKGKIRYYEELKEETAIRQIVTYYFQQTSEAAFGPGWLNGKSKKSHLYSCRMGKIQKLRLCY